LKVCLAGTGAFGVKHLEAMAKIPGIEVVSLVGSSAESAREVAQQWKIPHWTGNLAESLSLPGLDAVILCTPTQLHAAQGEQCMHAGKHVMIEIPMADTLADSERLVRVQRETGVVAMAGHTRRFNPSHQWIHKRVLAGELKVLQMDVQTYFFRRTNTNAPRLPHRGSFRLSNRAASRSSICARGTQTPDAPHCDGHVHRLEGRGRCHLLAFTVLQQ
jgi:2-hydroxy-4-carboxymuconate semialdehyde hemiacetal dehydrogenase